VIENNGCVLAAGAIEDECATYEMDLTGRKVLVVGLARSGEAAAKFLAARGARVTVNDSKTEAELAGRAARMRMLGIRLVLGSHPIDLFTEADLIVVSPGVPLSIEPLVKAKEAGVEIIGEIELAARNIRGKVVGITGSNGKTTTTTLIGELLKDSQLDTQVGGNIGTPLISLVEGSKDAGFSVIELSSFQLEGVTSLRANVAIVTNVTPDHMDRYTTFDDYVAAKRRIFLNQTASDIAILNADNEVTAAMVADTPAQMFLFSHHRELDRGIFTRGESLVYRDGSSEREVLKTSDIALRGTHNLENVMASLLAGLACGASVDSMREAIRRFRGVEHRLEWVATIDGVEYFNDSKATNVDAAAKAIEAFPGNIVLILGGKDKDSDYMTLSPLIRERIKHLVLIGAAADKIEAALHGVKPIVRASSMQDAVRQSRDLAESGDTVLLAPACASFDMFDNYEHRGRVFKEEVARLK